MFSNELPIFRSSLEVHFGKVKFIKAILNHEKHVIHEKGSAKNERENHMRDNEFEFWQMEAGDGKMEADIFKAMEVFARKTGSQADLVVVNPVDLAANPIAAVGFEVQAMVNVQPGTIWVGRKSE